MIAMHNTDIRPNHMKINWHGHADADNTLPVTEASLEEKAELVGRTGLLMLSCGTGAWRVRSSMNSLAEQLGLVCVTDIGLTSLEYTCFEGDREFSQTLSLTGTGVNTHRLTLMENFTDTFGTECLSLSAEDIHKKLDEIEQTKGFYSPVILGLASALACCGFTFLLGGGPVEMLLAFLGAGVGNGLRSVLLKHKLTLFLCITASVAAACLVYACGLRLLELGFDIDSQHQAGYICSMLFIIPGFPFITSGIDLAKQDMRSGIERLTYAVMIVLVATLVAWLMALVLRLEPVEFLPLGLSDAAMLCFRLIASFCGVFGFSLMFNSPVKLAATAAVIGAFSNTLRLELVDLGGLPPAAAAFFGALAAGLLASLIKKHHGYPRICITVPSIVIMVPGLYFYRAVYTLGVMDISSSASWMAASVLIVMALPLGLIFARILTDKSFRYCS